MNLITKLFTKKKVKQTNEFAMFGSIGVSPKHMMSYQDSLNKIKEYESKK